MDYKKMNFKKAGLFFAAAMMMSAFSSASAQDVLEQAKKLFSEKKYSEANSILDKEIKKANPSVEMLRLAMESQLLAGNPISAGIIASELLKINNSKDINLVYRAAEIAVMSGESKLALSRFYTYLENSQKKDDKYISAVSYVLSNGPSADAYKKATEAYGIDVRRKANLDYAAKLLKDKEFGQLIGFTEFMLKEYYGSPSTVEELLGMINASRSSFNREDMSKMVDTLIYNKMPEKANINSLYDFLRNSFSSFDNSKKIRVATTFVETNKRGLPDDLFVYPYAQQMSATKDAAQLAELAKKYVDAEPAFRSENSDRNWYNMYLMHIGNNPKTFGNDQIMPQNKMNDCFKAYVKRFADNPYFDCNNLVNVIVSNFLAGDRVKQIDFLKSNLTDVNGYWMRMLLEWDKANAQTYIQAYMKSLNAFQREREEWNLLPYYRANKQKDKFKAAFKSCIRNNPSFSHTSLFNECAVFPELTPAELVAMVSEVYGQVGYNNSIAEFVKLLKQNKTYNTIPETATLATSVDQKKPGSDAYANSLNKLLSIQVKNDSIQALDKAAEEFLAAYKGKVPGNADLAENAQEFGAYLAFERCWGVKALNNVPAIMACAERWAPRIKTIGPGFDDMINVVYEKDRNRQGKTLWNISQPYIQLLAAGQKPYDSGSIWKIANTPINPPKQDVSLFEPAYGAYPSDGVSYIANNGKEWTSDFYFAQVKKLLASDMKGQLSVNDIERLTNVVKSSPHIKDVQPELIAQLLKSYMSVEKRKNAVNLDFEAYGIYDMFNTAKKPEAAGPFMAEYGKLLREYRDKFMQMASINDFFARANIDKNVSVNFITTDLKALVESWPDKEWKKIPIQARLLENLSAYSSDDKLDAGKRAECKKLLDKIVGNIFAGNATIMNWGAESAIQPMIPYVAELAKANRITELEQAVGVVADAMSGESNVGRGMDNLKRLMVVLKDSPPQIRYVLLAEATKGANEFNVAAKKAFVLEMSKIAKDIPGMIPVNKNDPAYTVFMASELLKEGNALQAWVQLKPGIGVLSKRWKEFDFDFVLWAIDQMRKNKMYEEAKNLSMTIWLDEASLPPESAANLAILKGDIYRDMKNYPAAKIEYEGLNSNPRYNKTDAGRMAKFRLVSLLILTQDYANARLMLERLIDSRTVVEQAEAYYLLGRLEYEQKEYQAAGEYLREVFKRVHGHPDARLLEGELKLATKNFRSAEIIIGEEKLQTTVIPGSALEMKIQDSNLSIVRGGKSIPVIVSTTVGKDSERVELLPSPDDMTLFSGKISTGLGKPTPNNLILEINGNDDVQYIIDPEFQKANKLEYPAKNLDVKAPAKLYISSKKIISLEEQESISVNESLLAAAGLRSESRSNKIVRPGSPIYIRVVDFDRDISDAKDKVVVDIASSTGDEIRGLELTETEPHSGIFEAILKTGVPFPLAIVSDAKENSDINAIINSKKTGTWQSVPDGAKPKWVEVDTMTSFNFKEITVEVPNPKAIKQFKLFARLDKSDDLICVYPQTSQTATKGGLTVKMVNEHRNTLQDMVNSFKRAQTLEYWAKDPAFKRDNTTMKGRDGWTLTEVSGHFWLDQPSDLDLKFMQNMSPHHQAYLLIDDKLVLAANASLSDSRPVFLSKGVHSMTIYVRDHSKSSEIGVGYGKPDGTYELLPEEWFDPSKKQGLAEYLKPKAKIVELQNGFRITLDKPSRYRSFKWVVDDYAGNQVEVSKILAKDADGNAILPVEQDFSTGKTNSILEIAAGDQIEVKYSDEKRLDDNKAVLSDKLSSSFNNGEITLSYEEIKVKSDGTPTSIFTKAKRVSKGDSLIVIAKDIDEDLTENQEVIKAEVTTSSGEKTTLDLLETKDPGVFSQVLKTGDKTQGDTIKVLPGDNITVSYIDKENNAPGIPIARSYSVSVAEGSKPTVTLYKTSVTMVEDKSPAALAKIRSLKEKGDKREDIKIFKEQINPVAVKSAKAADQNIPVTVSSKAPLLFEVTYPEMAKHMNSQMDAYAVSQSELDDAKKNGRQPAELKVPMQLKRLGALSKEKGYNVMLKEGYSQDDLLDLGLFAGVVRLQLGAIGDEINDVVTNNEAFDLKNTEETDSNAFKIPTMIVSGSDKVYITVKNQEGKELAKRIVELKSSGELELLDKNLMAPMETAHLGQNFYLRVYDPDQDVTDDRDNIQVTVKSKLTGDEIKLNLSETLPHSGVFTGVVKTEAQKKGPDGKPLAVKPEDRAEGTVITTFGDEITFTYTDNKPLDSDQPKLVSKTGKVLIGADADVASFTKKFADPDMAVKTNFLMAEALFEMAKSHKALKKDDLAKEEIERGKRILEEALRDYPDTNLKAQGEFLLANLAQNLEQYQEAIGRYSLVISRWPESEYAVKSQFQKAQCLEKLGNGLQACEEYVKLTYLYPESSLVADAKIRLGNFYYKEKKYKSASVIFKKFAENHPEHPLAAKSLFLAAHSELKYQADLVEIAKQNKQVYTPEYSDAIKIFQEIVDKYQDDKDLRPEAMYWLGDCYFKMGQTGQEKSYQIFKRLTWDYPESKWAKIARGRLAEAAK